MRYRLRTLPLELTGATALTATLFFLYGGVYVHWRLTNRPLPSGDPDIGFGIVACLGLLNLLVAVWWFAWLSRVARNDPQ